MVEQVIARERDLNANGERSKDGTECFMLVSDCL
jgi:hypothetical protein